MHGGDDELDLFLKRAIQLGVLDAAELADLIPDPTVQAKLLEAADHNPLRGRKTTVADLEAEWDRQVAVVLEREAQEREALKKEE